VTSAHLLSSSSSSTRCSRSISPTSSSPAESCTYHYTCHLRGIGVKDQGVKLLQQIQGVDFTPLEKTDQCCGFGGTFAVKYPAISGAIVEDKATCIAATGANTVICNDAGCTMNISGMLHRARADAARPAHRRTDGGGDED
jgi:L-lactate dehydrogenase complex protein LldE